MDSAIKIQSTKRAQNEVKTDSIARLSDAKTAVSAQKTAGAGAREKVEKAQRARAARSMHGLMQRAMLGQFVTRARFLLWATTNDREKSWRASPFFGEPPADEVEEQLDSLEEVRGRHPAG